ncbi:unnamed protein product [Sphagnum jensenii]|uniref:DNA polymerase eta n=1 Tax=Sphagnum jensenii TaxID=128206 RepID=A0ABP0WXN4_9BRYO
MDETTGYTCVVLHVDLDCFYAAVEHVRLSIPKEQPLAVQQWDGLIAVNYAARAAGIARHERAGEALRKVGILEFVCHHAATPCVFSIFRRFSDICERASIDEAYLDVSDQDRLLAGAIIAERIRSAVRMELGYTCSVGIATNKLLAKIASAKNKPDRQTLIPPRAVPGLMQMLPLRKIKLLGGKLGEEMKQKWGCLTAGDAQQIPQAELMACFGERLGTYAWKAVRGFQADKVQVKQISKSMLAAKSFSATSDLSAVRRWLGILAEELSIRMHRDFEQNHRQPKLLQLYYRSGHFKHSADHSKSVAMPPAVLQLLSLSRSHLSGGGAACQRQGIGQLSGTQGLQRIGAVDMEATEAKQDQQSSVQGAVDDGKDDAGFRAPCTDGVAGAVTERTRALAKVLEEKAFQIFERLDDAFPCSRLALAASGFQELPSQGIQSIQHFFSSGSGQQHLTLVDTKQQTVGLLPKPVEIPVGKPTGILKFLTPNPTVSLSLGEHEVNCGKELHCPFLRSNAEVCSNATSSEFQFHVEASAGNPRAESSSDLHSLNAMPVNLQHKGVLSNQLEDKSRLQSSSNQSEVGEIVEQATMEEATSWNCTLGNSSRQDEVQKPPEDAGHVDLETVDVEEQRRILEGIYKSQHGPLHGQPAVRPQKKIRGGHESHLSSSKRVRGQQSGTQPNQPSISTFFHTQNKP